jgi:prevent-host-death family protein
MTIFLLFWLKIMKNHTVSATEFKAKCLAYLDEIEQHGGPITITRRGRPVAVLGRAKRAAWKSPRNSWAGKVRIVGDIVNVDMSSLWEVVGKEQG